MAKYVKVRNNQSGEIIEIIIKDFSGRTIDKYKFNSSNSRSYGQAIESLYFKFNIKPLIHVKDSVLLSKNTSNSLFDY